MHINEKIKDGNEISFSLFVVKFALVLLNLVLVFISEQSFKSQNQVIN